MSVGSCNFDDRFYFFIFIFITRDYLFILQLILYASITDIYKSDYY